MRGVGFLEMGGGSRVRSYSSRSVWTIGLRMMLLVFYCWDWCADDITYDTQGVVKWGIEH